ncbi:MAG: hypothetical protein ACRDQ5_26320 [Sciscionella sp.]
MKPVGDEVFVHRAALERREVAVDGLPGFGDLRVDGGEFGVPVGVCRPVLRLFVGDGVVDEVVPRAVERASASRMAMSTSSALRRLKSHLLAS